MKILTFVLARGHSRRIARKNLLLLGNKPLIAWLVDAAKNIPEVCEILVSTDDSEIAAVARSAGALVPWPRPTELATNTAPVWRRHYTRSTGMKQRMALWTAC